MFVEKVCPLRMNKASVPQGPLAMCLPDCAWLIGDVCAIKSIAFDLDKIADELEKKMK